LPPILGLSVRKDQSIAPDANVVAEREAAPMSADQDARLILQVEIDRAAHPLAGVVRGGPDGPGEAFVGWMGLTRAIELALERRQSEDG